MRDSGGTYWLRARELITRGGTIWVLSAFPFDKLRRSCNLTIKISRNKNYKSCRWCKYAWYISECLIAHVKSLIITQTVINPHDNFIGNIFSLLRKLPDISLKYIILVRWNKLPLWNIWVYVQRWTSRKIFLHHACNNTRIFDSVYVQLF